MGPISTYMTYLAYFDPFWPIWHILTYLTSLDLFWPFLAYLNYFDLLWPVWPILTYFEPLSFRSIWPILIYLIYFVLFWPFLTYLTYFDLFWPIWHIWPFLPIFTYFYLFWPILTYFHLFDLFWPMGPILTLKWACLVWHLLQQRRVQKAQRRDPQPSPGARRRDQEHPELLVYYITVKCNILSQCIVYNSIIQCIELFNNTLHYMFRWRFRFLKQILFVNKQSCALHHLLK